MMQETALQVFVVALGLLLCPRDPGVEEWDEVVTPGLQKHEERLLRGKEKLDQVGDKMTQNGNQEPHDYINNFFEQKNQLDRHPIEKDGSSDSDLTVSKEPRGRADHRLPKESVAKSATSLEEDYNGEAKTEQDVFTNGFTKDSGSLQGRNKKPEELEQKSPAETETAEKALADTEGDYLWYIWNTFSIISTIRFLRKYLRRSFQMNREVVGECRVAEVQLPDVATLHYFFNKCVQISCEKKWREGEFLEGFAGDLLEAMRSICDNNGSAAIQDFQVNTCDIVVHFTPPEPYGFQCQLGNNQVSDRLLDTQVCGQIKLVEEKKSQNGCPCQSSEEEMVCLLHCESDIKTKTVDIRDVLCSKNSPFLSKVKVARWFQSTVKQAWAQISHKYEFELIIRHIEAPGALVIRFRSGKKISFNMNPVIKFNSKAHFFITPWSSSTLDIFWTLSLTNYEDCLFEYLSKHLPGNSCHNQTLEIACFIHKRQMALTGSTPLMDCHFKMALMHLLLTKKSSEWNPNFVAHRLQDLLGFIEESLEKKLLTHVLIGNPLAQVIELPTEFTKTKPVNLFHPFVVHNCLYQTAVTHFQEMLRNTQMLIHEYVAHCTESANSLERCMKNVMKVHVLFPVGDDWISVGRFHQVANFLRSVFRVKFPRVPGDDILRPS